MMVVLLILIIFCAIQTVRASQLLNATIWLAAVSALLAAMLYSIDAWQIAVIELSVGTGLVTVLMVFAITMVGNEAESVRKQISPLLLVITATLFLLMMTVPFIPNTGSVDANLVSDVLWQDRALDLLPQIALMFAGVLGVLGLMRTDTKSAQNTQHEREESVAEPQAQFIEKEAA